MKFPCSISFFNKIRSEHYYYVDKTAIIHRLVTECDQVFLSRPRRFGKSLTVSTLKEYFLGHRQYFVGLALERLATEWVEHPVLHIDFATHEYSATDDLLSKDINTMLRQWEELYGVSTHPEDTHSQRFRRVIEAAHARTGQQVVVLIDEYDKPLLSFIDDPERFDQQRKKLQAFYTVLKICGDHIRFAFITGVSRFSKLSVFSGLNNLTDISLNRKYATLCGITEAELRGTFAEAVSHMAGERHITEQECYQRLKHHYDGYQFAPDAERVYNSFSLCNALMDGRFDSYWEQTGLPSFLVTALRDSSANYNLQTDLTAPIDLATLAQVDAYKQNPIPLLFQTGYLTLDKYDEETDTCTLRIPNFEVRKGLLTLLSGRYLSPSGKVNKGFKFNSSIAEAARRGDARRMMHLIKELMDAHPFVLKRKRTFERDFQNCIYIITQMVGLYSTVELATRRGRIDASIVTGHHVFVIEYKLDRPAQEALDQIDTNDYTANFKTLGRPIFAIGVSFSKASRSIDHYLVRHPDGSVTDDEDDDELMEL